MTFFHCAIAVLGLWLAAGTAVAGDFTGSFVDPLDAPSTRSSLASSTQLLAVTRAGERLVAAGMRGHIVYSDDSGRTWSQAGVPVSVTLTALSFPSPEQGWAVGHSGVVLHSVDGGVSWQRQSDGRSAAREFVAYYEERAVAGDETAASLARDLPINWQEGPEQPWLGVWFGDEAEGFVVGAFGLIARTGDGGRTWLPWVDRVDNPGGLHLNAIERIGSTLYIPSERGVVFRMRQGENRFEAVQTDYTGSFFGLCGDERMVIAYGLRGTMFASFDQGDTWAPLPPVIPVALTSCTRETDGMLRLAAASGNILSVTDDLAGPRTEVQPGASWPLAAVAIDANGGLVAVGMRGVWRQPADDLIGQRAPGL
ncbi:MAG: hypothetical protein KDI05_01990 [Halieaceae bacterium]|nr:hypothetical protein [Halieaceae bacterium]MCP5202914.1 glycosyl hydrolase [Pseudomonadales bacterium]